MSFSLDSNLVGDSLHQTARVGNKMLKEQDLLSQPINLNYRGSDVQGTVLGGCCSIFIKLTLAFIVVSQLYAFLFEPTYVESISVHYLNSNTNVSYEIPVQSMLPTFAICNNIREMIEGHTLEGCNDLNYWNVTFVQEELDKPDQHIAAVKCGELIGNWTDVTEELR